MGSTPAGRVFLYLGDFMKKIIFLFVLTLFIKSVFASTSVITESYGYACLSEDRTKRQAEEMAINDAKRNAAEKVSTKIKSQTLVEDLKLKNDIVESFASSNVKVIEQEGKWDKEPPAIGDCYKVRIKAEVIPTFDKDKSIETLLINDPSAPLVVNIFTNKKVYKVNDTVKIYLQGNKPFYAKIFYKDSSGQILQILPNPYRSDYHFEGGVIYEVPSARDRFELKIEPPFGEDEIILYASTTELGNVDTESVGAVYKVKMTNKDDLSLSTRGISLKPKTDNTQPSEEFFEKSLKVNVK